MEIILKPISELQAYENNPRLNDRAVEPVAKSIEEFGFKVPILLDKDNVIIAGHTRLKAAEKLGMTEVPCIMCDDLNPEQVRAFRLADNKVAEFAEWDDSLLLQELNELSDMGVDLKITGFPEEELRLKMQNLDDYDISGFFEDAEPKAKEDTPERIQCPHCGEWFDV